MIAMMPTGELAKDIESIRQKFADRYGAKAALKPPVHITLVPPFKAPQHAEDVLVPVLKAWGALQIPFPLTLQDFNSFRNNGVIFIDVARNDLLHLFHKDLLVKFNSLAPLVPQTRTGSYHPHITIGYRDIPPEKLDAAIARYNAEDFFATFVIERFYLWKHDGHRWQIHTTFEVGNQALTQGYFSEPPKDDY